MAEATRSDPRPQWPIYLNTPNGLRVYSPDAPDGKMLSLEESKTVTRSLFPPNELQRQVVAEQLAGDYVAQMLQQGRPSTQNEPSTSDALKQFLELPKHDDFKCYLGKSFPPLTLLSTNQRIQKFLDKECGRKDKEGKPLIKPGGRHAYYRAIRAFLNWAYSPASGLGLDPSKNPIKWVIPPDVPKRIMPAQTEQTVEILLSNVDNTRDTAIIATLIDSGGRRAEVANICQDDINWDAHRIRAIAKGNKEVYMPFSLATEKLLKDFLAEHHPNGGSIWGLTENGFVSVLRRLEKKSGIKCNAHTFRRGFACIQRRNGVDSLDIMRLGHWKSLRMVQWYTESIDFEDSQTRYVAPMERLADATCGLSKKEEVPRPRIELGTRGFSVRCSTD